jgi:hypothetical protein
MYRIGCDDLLDRLRIWNAHLHRRVHLIACGGTAMTLLGVKDSTKDIDIMVPDTKEHDYLIRKLQDLGYRGVTGYGWSIPGDTFVFDIFKGNFIHTTELLQSPLEQGNHTLFKEFSSIYLGVLNDYDLISSKLIRGTSVDIDDCRSLLVFRGAEIDWSKLECRYRELASYQLNPEAVNRNLDLFLEKIREEG